MSIAVTSSDLTATTLRLGSVADIIMGQAPPGGDCNPEGKGTIFVKAGEFAERFPLVREWTTRPLKFAQSGDVLICVVGATAGKINQAIDCAIGRSVAAVRPSPKLVTEYLYHFLSTKVSLLRAKSQGLAQGVITREMLKELSIPLPPLTEQQRIADVLDRAEALRAKRRAALTQLESFTQSIYLDMFPGSSDPPWDVLDSVCELITDGTHYTPTYSETGVIFLSSRNVTSGYIRWDDVKFIPNDLHAELHRRVSPRLNDILLAKNGTTGIAAIVDRDCVFDIYVSLALLRPSNRVLPIFLQQAINSPASTRQFNSSLKGIGVPNLHLKEIRNTKIPVPPIGLQRKFARRVAAIEKLKSSQCASLAELDALFAALQHRAFRGELF